MARYTVEKIVPGEHRNHMPEVQGPETPTHVLVVDAGRYRLEFQSLAQLETAIAYFQSPARSTRLPSAGGDHWEFQPWHCRLPAGISNARNRSKVLAALLGAREIANEHLR